MQVEFFNALLIFQSTPLLMDGGITRETNVNRRNNGTNKARQETH